MGLRNVVGDIAITISAGGAATNVSGPIANPGFAADVVLLIHVSATTGSPTLNGSLEVSDDNSSWSALAGSSFTQLTAAGSAISNARITKPYVRVTTTVAGTTPAVTYTARVLVIPE